VDNRVELPETGKPSQGKVLTPFEVTNEVIDKARDLVISSLDLFKSQREGWRVKNIMRDRAYRAILEPPKSSVNSQQVTDTVGRAYVGIDDKASPIINDNCEAIKARLKESILPLNKDFVSVESESIDPRLLEIRKDELNKQLSLNDIEEKMDVVAHNAVVFGTYYISVPLVNSESSVLTRQLLTKDRLVLDDKDNPIMDSNGEPITQKIQELGIVNEIDKKYFGPGYDPIKDVEDVYLDMFIEDIQSQPIVIRKYLVGWEHLMQGVQAGIYFDDTVAKIKDKFVSANNSSARSERILSTVNNSQFNNSSTSEASPREYKMYQAYCDFSLTEKDASGQDFTRVYKMVISVIDNEVIQLMPNPYFHQMIPILKGCYRGLPGEAYGMSSIDTVLDMYHEYNDTMNQINDSKILSLNPIKIVSARSQTDKRDLSIFPGAEWIEKQPGDIRFAQFDFSTVANGMNYLELLELKINKGMGVQRLMQGMGDQTDLDHTATGVSKVIEQADKKFRMIAKRIENVSIRGWAEMAYKVNVQFNPFPLPNIEVFSNINSEVNFLVKGVDNFFDNLEATNRLISFVQQGASIPGFNLLGFMLQIAKNLNISLDPSFGPMFNPPPPVTEEQKPLGVSVTMPVDMTKGTLPAMAAAQILAKKGIQLDLDAIGEAGALITETTPDQIKEESGILPQEKKRSLHRIKTSNGGDQETVTDVGFS